MDPSQQETTHFFDDPTHSVLVAIGLAIVGMIASAFGEVPAILVDPGMLEGEPSRTGFLVSFSFGYVAMAAAGLLYLHYTDRGWSYIDLRIPTLGDWKYTIFGVLGALGIVIGVSLLSEALGVPSADHQILEIVGDDSTLVLYLIALVFLFNAPAEELLFRNVIQKRLYQAFTPMHAVVATSIIFAAVHFPVYAFAAPSLSATLVSLLVVFGGSIVFGWVFVRTENLVVPTLAHAGLNAFSFLQLYILIEYFPEELETVESTAMLVVSLL